VASGSYQLRSHVDLTVEALLPEPAANTVTSLRDFQESPGKALFDLAEEAGVPAVGTLRKALPGAIEKKLYGWIDDEIATRTVDGVKVTDRAGSLAALAETALTRFALESDLLLDGQGHAKHTLTTLDLSPTRHMPGFETRLPLSFDASTTSRTEGSTLALGDHTYGLPYGEYVWRALGDVRGTLGAAVDCPALATKIAAKCELRLCVGHERELAAICETGLDKLVDRARTKITAIRLDALHFSTGTVTLVDANHDGVAEALAGGIWTAEINAGQGLRHVPATFATR
jgi:hypothetical protein